VRRKQALKRGGGRRRQEFREDQFLTTAKPDEALAVHEALDALERTNPAAAELVKLRYFAGFTIHEAAAILEWTLCSSSPSARSRSNAS